MSDPFNPYQAEHKIPNGPGDARPTALQIIEDEDLYGKWSGRTCLVTGSTAGIGPETARALHATGADVFITARDMKKAKAVVDDIRKTSQGDGRMEVVEMELSSLASVKAGAQDFFGRASGLNVLVNNAGIMAAPRQLTVDGFESQFAINYLSHFALTALLLPMLTKSSMPGFNSRIVNVSSSSHRYSSVHFDDINLEKEYDPFVSYGQSKIANIWHSNYIDRVYGPKGVHSLSVMPGSIWTNLLQYVPEDQLEHHRADTELNKQMKSAEQGAATTVWAAAAKVWEGKGGKYLADYTVAPPATNMTSTMDSGVGPDAYNKEGEVRLWEVSLKMTGVDAA